MAMQSPLPVRDGVNATRLRLPQEGPWGTVMDYVLHRFGHVDPDGIVRRFETGEVVGLGGEPLNAATPLGGHEFLWYYRNLPVEEPVPFTEDILFQDGDLLVVDKPHFLPTTPGGRFVQESALVRLRNRLGLPDLIPMHRLDRATAGVILFSTNPQTRGAYQTLFERRAIRKEYECVSALPHGVVPEGLEFPLTYGNRMTKRKGHLLAIVEDGEPNAESGIDLVRTGTSAGTHAGTAVGHFLLRPRTGKTHQLRVHMAALGLGILNDPFYPVLWDKAPDDHARPLQLLARSVAFTDPLTGTERTFRSRLELRERPGAGPSVSEPARDEPAATALR
ncbi:pseudouridylate synthase [Zafaria cholistanensis]|uniref:RNA pseudouridylate synthase n=2 Tax=Zafaria cholistanensis TaxID=1682741 RepID=A0A5A7NQ52_9MICC|nr:pseudouridylate synthase [Zafaria cholistanensis]